MSLIWTPPTTVPSADLQGVDLGEEFDGLDCSHFIDEYIDRDMREVKTIANYARIWSRSKRGQLQGYHGPRYSQHNYRLEEVPAIRQFIRERLAQMVALSLANDTKE